VVLVLWWRLSSRCTEVARKLLTMMHRPVTSGRDHGSPAKPLGRFQQMQVRLAGTTGRYDWQVRLAGTAHEDAASQPGMTE
jgi:hypothetical protein